jgi:hypothetical protein
VARQVGVLDEDVLYDRAAAPAEPEPFIESPSFGQETEPIPELAYAFPVGESCKI